VSYENLSGDSSNRFGTALRWMLKRKRPHWPRPVQNDPFDPPPKRVEGADLRVTLVGHASVLIQTAGLNILTDPVWSWRVGPMPGVGIRRVRPPALPFEALPPIDLVLVSHNHYDHLDRPTLARLGRKHRPLVLTGRGCGRSIPKSGSTVLELDWWQAHGFEGGLKVSFVPAEHFSARSPFDRNRALWGGFVLEGPAGPIYFAGDTGDGPHFAEIRQRFGPMALSLLPIGAYSPRWFMSPVHIGPEEALAASLTLESKVSLAMHYATFPLADDPFDEPPRLLRQGLEKARAENGSRPGLDFRLPPYGKAVKL
jgi:L-ascorbate metabolism protein UlaG (beta-lactamase superfamily)